MQALSVVKYVYGFQLLTAGRIVYFKIFCAFPMTTQALTLLRSLLMKNGINVSAG